jgi:hypothetical protein
MSRRMHAQMYITGISACSSHQLGNVTQVLPEGVTLELAEIADLPLINTDLEEDMGAGETR